MIGTPTLHGQRLVLVPVANKHVPELRSILATPEVRARWGAEDASSRWPFDDSSATRFAVLLDGAVCGMVQCGEEDDPDYRHASIDIFLDPRVHGRGVGRDAVGTLARHLIHDRGHHRLVIDPAADNEPVGSCVGMSATPTESDGTTAYSWTSSSTNSTSLVEAFSFTGIRHTDRPSQ